MIDLKHIRALSPQLRFRYFIEARERARYHKELIGGPGPHSDDPIIAVNRFCNVNREDDAVTKWVKANVRDRWSGCGRRNVLIQVLVARLWNHPPTLETLLPYTSYDVALNALKDLRARGEKTMRGAYMMPVHGNHGKGKTVDEYYLQAVREACQQYWDDCDALAEVAEQLGMLLGIGDFLANQVCTDLRYTTEWRRAPDWGTFVLCGPGSRRGLDRFFGREPTGNLQQRVYIAELLDIREGLQVEQHPLAPVFDDPNNLANAFCEFDKFSRVLHGEAARLHTYP